MVNSKANILMAFFFLVGNIVKSLVHRKHKFFDVCKGLYFRPKKISGDKEIYLKYAKSRISLSSSPKSPSSEEEKVQKTSLDCATIALKVLKTSIKYQKFRDRHSGNNTAGQLEAANPGGEHQGA